MNPEYLDAAASKMYLKIAREITVHVFIPTSSQFWPGLHSLQ